MKFVTSCWIAAGLGENNKRRTRNRHVVITQFNGVSSSLKRRVKNLEDFIVLGNNSACDILALWIRYGT